MRTLAALLLVASTVAAQAPDPLERLQRPFRELAAKSAPSIVRVGPRADAPMLIGTPVTTLPMTAPPPSAGVVLGREWVLAHVTRALRTDRLSIATTDGKLFTGSVKARMKSPPLVLVHVPKARLEPLPLGSPEGPRVGSWVMMSGNAFGTSATGGPPATLGLVCARVEREGKPLTFAISAAANPGDAGGAVLDRDGRVAGIVTGQRSVGDVAEVIAIDAVLEALGDVEGFEPARAEAGPRDRAADAVSRHIRSLADRLRPAVVSLVVKRTAAAERSRPGPVRSGRALLPRFPIRDRAVSGFLVDDRGTILTAYMNLSDVKGRFTDEDGKSLIESIEVALPDGRTLPAKLIGAHEAKGFAVLRIDAKDLRPATLGRGRDLTVGRWLLTMGDPSGTEPLDVPFVGFGVVSDLSCEPERYDAILTDAPVNTATVGGPVVDMVGHVVGISTVAVSPKDASMRYGLNSGIGFVIPIEDAIALIPKLEREGVVRFRPGFLGVRLGLTPEPGGGIRITTVIAGTGAEKGGLNVDDVILGINGMDVGDGLALRQVLYSLAPGTRVILAIRRGDEARNVEIELSLRPDFPD